MQRVVAAAHPPRPIHQDNSIEPFPFVALSGRYRSQSGGYFSVQQPVKPRIGINSKQKAAAAAAVCLFAQQIFGGLNKYIFKLKSAASPGHPAAPALLRLGPVHFFWTKIKKEKKRRRKQIFFFTFTNAVRKKNKRGLHSAASNLGPTALRMATRRLWRNDSRLTRGLRHTLARAQ